MARAEIKLTDDQKKQIKSVTGLVIETLTVEKMDQKREKERQRMLSSLSKGDRVITSGGILGTIVGLTEKSAVLRVSDEPPLKIEFLRGAISRVVTRDDDNLEAS